MTITSKRQVTIPRKIWDELELSDARYLEADVQNGELRLKKADFTKQMEDFWQKTNSAVKGKLSDQSIKQASRRAHRR